MKQRIQIFIKVPKEYWNKENLNNKPTRIYALHNQWLYGHSFVEYASKLVKAIKTLIKKENRLFKGKYPIHYEEIIKIAYTHCNYRDLSQIQRTHWYGENTEDSIIKTRSKEIEELLKKKNNGFFDNNNGCIFIDLTGKEIICKLYNGYEDAEEIKERTPEEYINLFYNRTDFKAVMNMPKVKKAVKHLKELKKKE